MFMNGCRGPPDFRQYEVRLKLERVHPEAEPLVLKRGLDTYNLMKTLAHEASEFGYALLLEHYQGGLRVDGLYLLAKGGRDALLFDPTEIYKAALVANAADFIVIHNHPGGDPTPSEADVATGRQVVAGAELLGLRCRDDMIIGADAFFSLHAAGLIRTKDPLQERLCGYTPELPIQRR